MDFQMGLAIGFAAGVVVGFACAAIFLSFHYRDKQDREGINREAVPPEDVER